MYEQPYMYAALELFFIIIIVILFFSLCSTRVWAEGGAWSSHGWPECQAEEYWEEIAKYKEEWEQTYYAALELLFNNNNYYDINCVLLVLAAHESELKEMRGRVGDLEELISVDFSPSLVEVTGKGKEVAFLGQETTIQLNISSKNTLSLPFPIEQLFCQLMNPKSQHVPCHITHTQPEVCTLTFTPILLGPHQLKITIRDIDVPGSPFTIRVLSSSAMMRMNPEKRGMVQGIICDVIKPWCVAVSNSGEVVVSEYSGHRISVYSREGKLIRSFGSEGSKSGQFYYPHGVAITSDNHILVADEYNHRIHMFTIEGRFVKSVGKKGQESLENDARQVLQSTPLVKCFLLILATIVFKYLTQTCRTHTCLVGRVVHWNSLDFPMM